MEDGLGLAGLLVVLAVVLAALTLGAAAALVELLVDFLVAAVALPTLSFLTLNGWLITLASPAVGIVVQYQTPLANAQLWPSLANV